MCQPSCQTKLFENESSYINWCDKCNMYTLVYHTSCIALSRREFRGFHKVLCELEDSHFLPYHVVKDTVILKSTKGLMGISLSRDQANELMQILEQAILMEEVFSLLNHSS